MRCLESAQPIPRRSLTGGPTRQDRSGPQKDYSPGDLRQDQRQDHCQTDVIVAGSALITRTPVRTAEEAVMSFIDDVAGKSITTLLGSSSNPLAANLLQMINQQPGGLSGLVQHFHEKGFSEVITSWVGTGQNLPISADQIQHISGQPAGEGTRSQSRYFARRRRFSAGCVAAYVGRQTHSQRAAPGYGSLLEKGMNLLKSLGKTEAGCSTGYTSRCWARAALRPFRARVRCFPSSRWAIIGVLPVPAFKSSHAPRPP